MRLFVRHTVAVLLAVVFGPLTSGYPVVLALCGANDGAPMLCRMTECDDTVPTGVVLTSPACCTPYVVADVVSKTYVKPHQPVQDPTTATVARSEDAFSVDQTPRSLDRRELDPAVHPPPLYISHQALLI